VELRPEVFQRAPEMASADVKAKSGQSATSCEATAPQAPSTCAEMLGIVLGSIPVGSSSDSISLFASRPDMRSKFDSMTAVNKSRLRAKLTEHGYPVGVSNILMPRAISAHLLSSPEEEIAKHSGLPLNLQHAIALAVGVQMPLPIDKEFWGIERIGKATEAVLRLHHDQPKTIHNLLCCLRKFFAGCGISDSKCACCNAPAIEALVKDKESRILKERGIVGIILPPRFARLDDIRSRVDAYLAAGRLKADGDVLADVMVCLSMRSGEIYTLKVAAGGVTGVLKKRGDKRDAVYPIVSCVGEERASELLNRWNDLTEREKDKADAELNESVKVAGINKRNFRKYGASLAILAAGDTAPTLQAKVDVAVRALRHDESFSRSVDHYLTVREPEVVGVIRLADYSPAVREQLASIAGISLASNPTVAPDAKIVVPYSKRHVAMAIASDTAAIVQMVTPKPATVRGKGARAKSKKI
jgi:hypothetical protein